MRFVEGNFHTRPPSTGGGPSPPAESAKSVQFLIDFPGPVSGQKLIAELLDGTIEYADQTNIDHAKMVLGMTLVGSGTGIQVPILAEGYYEDSSMLWSVGALYLGVGGNIVQTPPTSGILMQVGKAISPTMIYIHLNPAIILL